MVEWKPKRTMAECDRLITSRGQLLETEQQIVDGRVLKVYKNLWPTLRAFFLASVKEHGSKEMIVFQNERVTYKEALERTIKAAGLLCDRFGVRKGDKVAIVSRNYPEWIIAFWAIQLLGGISVCVNAWLSSEPLHHSIRLTKSKVVILDPECAAVIDQQHLRKVAGTEVFLVFRPHEVKSTISKMETWTEALQNYRGNPQDILNLDIDAKPDDDATIFFTSGTTGLPKGVLSSHRAFLTCTFNSFAGGMRTCLRNGEPIPAPDPNAPQKALLLAVPLFHVTGACAYVTLGIAMGTKIVLMRKWEVTEGIKLIKKEKIESAGGVPAIIWDILISSDSNDGLSSIENMQFGGAPPPGGITRLIRQKFPLAVPGQAYGLTETNAGAIGHSGNDYLSRPDSTGYPAPINEIVIVKDGQVQRPGESGEIWLRGCNVMKEYYNDPEATRKALTPDGWYKSGDIGYMDAEGFVYIKDRAKDIIIRGGENVDSISVENAIYADPRVMEVAAIGVPDKRLGELVAAVVTLKPNFQGQVKPEELIKLSQSSLPKFAVPVMVLIESKPLERNSAGKLLKDPLRQRAAKEWKRRKDQGVSTKL